MPRRSRRPVTTQRQAGVVPAPNWLNQDFSAPAPNRKWVSDFTYIETGEGWLYLAVVLDLFSRRVIGWAMRATMDGDEVRERESRAGEAWLEECGVEKGKVMALKIKHMPKKEFDKVAKCLFTFCRFLHKTAERFKWFKNQLLNGFPWQIPEPTKMREY